MEEIRPGFNSKTGEEKNIESRRKRRRRRRRGRRVMESPEAEAAALPEAANLASRDLPGALFWAERQL